MIQIPTGGGKTVVASRIVSGARAKRNRVVFCVPSLSLIDQTVERFVENSIPLDEIGVIQSNHPLTRPHAPVQVASVQTLQRREFPLTDLVIVDEAHVRYDVIDRWMADKPDMLFTGLSATPWSKGLGLLYDHLIKPVSMADLIEQGYLSPFRVFAPSHPDLTGVKTLAGDYQEDQLGEAMSKPKLIADIVETWCARAERRPTLCFAVNRAHAALIHDQFERAGVASAYVDANTPREEREVIGRRLAAREIDVVVNIGTLTTGVDWDVRCIILARPTKSEILFVQIVGRGLRTAEGKDYCLILDHSDTHARLGMVDEIDHERMPTGAKGKSEGDEEDERPEIVLPKECASCGCLVPPRALECPACGHVNRRKANVVTEAGSLEELGRDRKTKGKAKTVTEALREMGKHRVWAQIQGLGEQNGWSEGRMAYVYKDIFGVWPAPSVKSTPPDFPSPELFGFEHARRIAFARSKQRQREGAA